VERLAIAETSRAKGHEYVTLAAGAEWRAVISWREGRDANTIEGWRSGQTASISDPSDAD
jgi:transposase